MERRLGLRGDHIRFFVFLRKKGRLIVPTVLITMVPIAHFSQRKSLYFFLSMKALMIVMKRKAMTVSASEAIGTLSAIFFEREGPHNRYSVELGRTYFEISFLSSQAFFSSSESLLASRKETQ